VLTSRIVVLDMHQAISLDNTALDTLDAVRQRLQERGGALLLCALNDHPALQVQRSAFGRALGGDNVLPDHAAGLVRARALAATLQKDGMA
jgi:anti-anti-sigma regulatory factor